jgi:hypothetical protein
MEVVTVPMLKDNLGYLVRCLETRRVFFVDISHSSMDKFYGILEEYGALDENLIILTTHKVYEQIFSSFTSSLRFFRSSLSMPIIPVGISKQVESSPNGLAVVV